MASSHDRIECSSGVTQYSINEKQVSNGSGLSTSLSPVKSRQQSSTLDNSELSFLPLRPHPPVPPVRSESLKRGQIGNLQSQSVEINGDKDHTANTWLRRVQSKFLGKSEVREIMMNLASNTDSEIVTSHGNSYLNAPVKPPRLGKAPSRVLPKLEEAPDVLPKCIVSKYHFLPVSLMGENEVIGFARLPDQVHRRAVKRGFEFSLMVVGESGLGKSTLVNTLFLAELYKGSDINERLSKTVEIEVKQIDLTEGGVKVRLNIVDTPGFGDSINSEECWEPIIKYIEHQYEQYFQAESGVNRKHIPDMRVHCCLYFISPYGHGLKQMDIDMMKRLHNKVNLIPLIAKADILTPKEVKNLKLKILEEIAAHHINIYQMAQFDSEDEDYDFKEEDNELRAAIPFAVVGCNSVVEAGGKKIRGRTYPWGIVEVDNPNHCDFSKLKKTISTHMQYLKDMTSEVLYENYRAEHLNCQEVGLKIAESKSSQMEVMLQQKDEEIRKMQILLSNLQNQMSEKLENDSSSNAKLQSSSEDNVDA